MALAEAMRDGAIPAEIVMVVSNVDGAGGLAHAQRLGLPHRAIENVRGEPRREHEAKVLAALDEARVDWICLAGYMRLLSADFVARYERRILNIHPSLLPSFPGLHPQRQALEAGVRISGCTVHLVDAGLDSGPIVLQRAVAVEDGDDEETLAARILVEEHRAYPEALRKLLTERFRVEGRRVVFEIPVTGG